MTTNPMDTRQVWLGHKVTECERLITSDLTRSTEKDLLQLASKVVAHAKAAGVEIRTENPRLARLFSNIAS